MKLKDKVVLITDGASRLGPVIAARLKAEGAVIVMNISPGSADNGNGDFVTHANPVSRGEVDSAVQSVLDKYGRIDLVVHNNNEIIRAGLEDCDDETFDRIMGINTKSAYLFVRAAGASMKKAKGGNFVFVSSIHAEKPNGAAFAYSIAKGAIKMLVKEMVLDLGPSNVRTNIVSTGPLAGDDKLFYSDLSPLYEHTVERIVNNKFGSPEDVANAVLFFAGDDCQSANGSELVLDGGFLLTYFTRRKNHFPPPWDPAAANQQPGQEVKQL